MWLVEYNFLPTEPFEVLMMVVDHDISFYTILATTKNHFVFKYTYICVNMQLLICGIMLKEERHQYILNRINQNYRVYITALSTELGVSDDTLRRDLLELDEKGLLIKVHGGAIAKSGIPLEFTDRLRTGIEGKQQIATKVVSLFQQGDVLLIDGGTSNLEVARQIPLDM